MAKPFQKHGHWHIKFKDHTGKWQTVRTNAPTKAAAARLLVAVGGGLLTIGDVAELLKVSTATVYALVKRGALPHLRVSNAIRVRAVDLEAYLAKPAAPGRDDGAEG